MRFRPHFPAPPVSEFVELIWVLQGVPDYQREKVLPNGVVELIINLGSPHKVVDRNMADRFEVFRHAWVAGMQERFLIIGAFGESDLVGIRFRPAGAHYLMRLPLPELTNQVVQCDALSMKFVLRLREQLLACVSHEEKVRTVERFLYPLAVAAPRRDAVVDCVLRRIRQEKLSLAAVARDVGFSRKHMINRFHNAVGVTPKLLHRIGRFQRVIQLASTRPAIPWTEVAHAAGYYDQSHLIRDFAEFSGATPEEYLVHRDADENHIIVA